MNYAIISNCSTKNIYYSMNIVNTVIRNKLKISFKIALISYNMLIIIILLLI